MKKMSDKIESNLSKLKIMEKKFNLGEQAVKEGGSHNMKMKGHTLDERKTENVNNSEKKKLEEELALLNAENNPSYINKNKLHEFLAKQYRKPEEKNTPNQYSKNHNNQSNPKSNHKRELSSNFQQKPKKSKFFISKYHNSGFSNFRRQWEHFKENGNFSSSFKSSFLNTESRKQKGKREKRKYQHQHEFQQ